MKKYMSLLLIIFMTINMVGCAKVDDSEVSNANKNLAEYKQELPIAEEIAEVEITDEVTSKFADFSVELFKKCIDDKDMLISPMSVLYALGMTANGANGETQDEMLDVLGMGMSMEEMNAYLKSYMDNLCDDDKQIVKMANSIWYNSENDRISVKNGFVQDVSNYYQSEIYKLPFNEDALKDINNWVYDNTDKMIDKALDYMDEDSYMYLINALVFDAKWVEPFESFEDDIFYAMDGSEETSEFMKSIEYDYLENENAIGFIKHYERWNYAFVAMQPKDENMTVEQMFSDMTGDKYIEFLNPIEDTEVEIKMPKFEYDSNYEMSGILQEMGIELAFDTDADFSNMVESEFPICINRVIHKTHIENTKYGTKAAAVTIVEMKDTACMPYEKERKEVNLNRPFAYMIIDTKTKLPLFIGSVQTMK